MSSKEEQKSGDLVIEIAFGDARKIARRAIKHPTQPFFAFERPSKVGRKGHVETSLPNLKLSYEGATQGLARLPKECASEVFIDLALEGDFAKVSKGLVDGQERIIEISDAEVQSNLSRSYLGNRLLAQIQISREECLHQTRRVLKPNGRLRIHTYQINTGLVSNLLDQTGFAHTRRVATLEETNQSRCMKGITESRLGGDPRYDDGAIIIGFTARKKKATPDPAKLLQSRTF